MNREKMKALLPVLTAYADGKPVQVSNCSGQTWLDYTGDIPNFNNENWTWRIKPLEFPKLPEGLEWHNKHGLTPEQVGEGFRLLVPEEVDGRHGIGGTCLAEAWDEMEHKWLNKGYVMAGEERTTYRIPSSFPFPEPPKPKVMVPLEPHDISPTDVLRKKDRKDFYAEHWMKIDAVNSDGPTIHFAGSGRIRLLFKTLMNEYEISRDGAKTWKPCEKESAS